MAVIITDFQLDPFRGGNPLRVLDLGNGINVALVHSEVGRSQLLRVVPWVLYGPGTYFSRRAGGDQTAPGSHGAIVVRSDHGVFRIERHWDSGGRAEPILAATDGTVYEPGYLRNILEGLPANAYREVFTFELSRMAKFVRSKRFGPDRLARLATYLKDRSPDLSVAADRPVSAPDLTKVQSRVGELTQLISRSADLEQQRKPPKSPAKSSHDKLKRELKKLESELVDSRAKWKHLQAEIDETQCAMAMNRVHAQLQEVQRELADNRPSKTARESTQINAEAAARLDDKRSRYQEELKELRAEREDLLRQAKELGDLKRTAQWLPQIDALLMQEKTLLKEETAIEQLRQEIVELESRLQAQRMQVESRSLDHTAARSSQHDSQAAARVDTLSERLREAEREHQLSEDRLTRAESAGQLASASFARASAVAAHPEDAVAVHECERRVGQLRELEGLEDQLQRLVADRDDLQAQMQRLYSRQLMPFRMTMALGMPFMIGVAMIIYGLVMPGEDPNWRLVLLGFIAAFVSAVIKITMDRGTSDLLQSSRRRVVGLDYQIEEINVAFEESDVSRESLSREREAAERDLAQRQGRFASHEPERELGPPEPALSAMPVESARIQLAEARRRHNDLKQQWRELMLEFDLSPNLTPAHAREALADRALHSPSLPERDEAENLEYRLRHLRNDSDRRRDWLAVLAGQAKQVLKELGLSSSVASLVDQLDVLREAVQEHKERMQVRRQLLRSLKRVRQKQLRAKEQGRRVAEQRRALEDDSRRKKDQQKVQQKLRSDRLKLLEKQRERLQRELAEIRQRHGVESQSPLADLADEELAERLENQSDQLDRIQDRLIKLSEQRGKCRAQLSQPSDREPPVTSSAVPIAWDKILDKTRQLAQECQRTTQAADPAKGAAEENGHQRYQYLEQASGYLQRLTNGQLVKISVPSDMELAVIDQTGQANRLQDIRREHFANLYFSLWLTRLEAYADRGLRLPIIMEDPLEATDEERKPVVAKLLRNFAMLGHQVILVTAEPRNAGLFSRLDIPIADLSNRETVPRANGELLAEPDSPASEVSVVPGRTEPLFPPQ